MDQSLEEKLMSACKRRDLRSAEELLLNHKLDPNYANEDGWTPLHLAVRAQDNGMVQLLLSYKVDVNRSNNEGWTPLHLAVTIRHTSCHIAQREPRHSVVEMLLNSNASVNCLNDLKQTPLHLACEKNFGDYVANLLDHNADLTITTTEDQTAPYLAMTANAERAWQEIVAKRGTELTKMIDKNGDTLLHLACKVDKDTLFVRDLVRYDEMLLVKNNVGEIALATALRCGKLEAVQRLATRMLFSDEKAEMAEHVNTCRLILSILESSKFKKTYDALELLRDFEFNDLLSLDRLLILASSADGQQPELIEELLRRGANIDARDPRGCTPLLNALRKGSTESVDIIMRHKPDLRAKSNSGATALHFAAENCRETDLGFFDLIIKLVRCIDVNSRDSKGRTPLHWAHREGNHEGAVVLLELGADMTIKTSDGVVAFSPHMAFHCRKFGDHIRRTSCCNPVEGHFRKLHAIGVEPNIEVKKMLPKCPHFAGLNERNSEDYQRVLDEVEAMKKEIINDLTRTSLYDVLFMKRKSVTTYSANSKFVKTLEHPLFLAKYPFYGRMLKYRYNRGSARKNLIDAAKQTMTCLLETNLTDECSEKIFQYLSEEQLETFGDKSNFFD